MALAKKILPKCIVRLLEKVHFAYNKTYYKKKYYDPKINSNKSSILYDYIEKEHTKHFGSDFPDKIFYVIRRLPTGSGILSNYHWVLNNTVYALSKEYIPVVNMENYKTIYNNKNIPLGIQGEGVDNAWEYYFEQPCGYSLNDIKTAYNIVLGDMNNYHYNEFIDPYRGELNISKYLELASQYCKFNLKTMEYTEEKKSILFSNKKNILGVIYRGTEMVNAKYHSTPASIEQTLQKTVQVFEREKFDHIFLATEDQNAVDEFYKVFSKEILFVSESERIKHYDSKLSIIEIFQKESPDVYRNDLDYLSDAFLLSQCDGIIASKNNRTMFALGWNNNRYRYSYVFDLGINP